MAQYQAVVDVTPVPGTTATSAVVTLPKGTIVSATVLTAGGTGLRGTTMHAQILLMSTPQADPTAVQAVLWGGHMRNNRVSSIPNMTCVDGQAFILQATASGNASSNTRLRALLTIETEVEKVRGGAFLFWEQPGSGIGTHVNKALPDPAAGADFAALTVPGFTAWRVSGFSCQLVAAVAVANRLLKVQYLNTAGAAFQTNIAPALVTAAQTVLFSFAQYANALSVGLRLTAALGLSPLYGSEQVLFGTDNIQAADAFTLGTFEVEEWAAP